ncbi:5710_t:CDS:2 [Entrophospora sp. SA101]|nr:8761_t:CDS:2 [Entrophospora candida]CAH1763210.1 12651_t:CDS:2 [Entrophospora sp. SA101]CAJ0846485.1 5710_t:CDS:2 [Entrophospora sp. SA101]
MNSNGIIKSRVIFLHFLDKTRTWLAILAGIVLGYFRDFHTIYTIAGGTFVTIITNILKLIFRQPRPYKDKYGTKTSLITSKEKLDYGMPSSHSSITIFFATFITLQLVIIGHHTKSQVIVGMLLGLICGILWNNLWWNFVKPLSIELNLNVLDPQNQEVITYFENLSEIYWRAGQYYETVFALQTLYRFNKNVGDSIIKKLAYYHMHIGEMEKSKLNYEKALCHYKEANNLRRGDPAIMVTLSQALIAVCDWKERGGIGYIHVDPISRQLIRSIQFQRTGYMGIISNLVDGFIYNGSKYGAGVIKMNGGVEHLINVLGWGVHDSDEALKFLREKIKGWKRSLQLPCEGGWLLRVIQQFMRRIQRRWYLDTYGYCYGSFRALPKIKVTPIDCIKYVRPKVPKQLPRPEEVPIVPFYTFSYELSPKQVRLVSHRTALITAYDVCTSSWLDDCVYPPPPPPAPRLKIGYISSDFRNHPLAHLMQSVFNLHDKNKYQIYCYSLTDSDGSIYRARIEQGSDFFYDCSKMTDQQIVQQIVYDGIHVLVNLNGYTAGEHNKIFAARPVPVQISYMGYCGTMGGMWTDYSILDEVVCPEDMIGLYHYKMGRKNIGDLYQELDPEVEDDDWIYCEKVIRFEKGSYFVNDHRQNFRDDEHLKGINDPQLKLLFEEHRRLQLRAMLFPLIPLDWVIFANFNQCYKFDPLTFKSWIEILEKVPKSILWLLKFPKLGASNLKELAREWAGQYVADRIIVTDVASKEEHVLRCRVADLVLDSPVVNGHTTTCDILWSGTPVLTVKGPSHKQCSRVSESIITAAGFEEKLVANDLLDYIDKAVTYSSSHRIKFWTGSTYVFDGILAQLRKELFLKRDTMDLFNTKSIVRSLEDAYDEAWQNWD